MKLYIAGKIAGLKPKDAELLFAEAEASIEKAGHTPLNPLRLVDQTGGRKYEEYFADALHIMKDADGVLLLSNWRESVGASCEVTICHHVGRPIYHALDELPIGSDWPEQAE